MSRPVPLTGYLGFLVAMVVALVAAAPAAAHDATTTAYAEVTGSGENVRAVLELEYDLLTKSAWLSAEAYEATDRSEQRRQLQANVDAVASYALDRFQVAYDDVRCTGSPAGVPDITERNGRAFAVVVLDYRCRSSAGGTHALFSALFPDEESFVHSTKTIVHYELGGTQGSAALEAGRPQHEVTDRDSGSTATTKDSSTARNLGGFVLLGGEHLLFGPDHLLFLLALLIGARGLRDVVSTVTTFTVAHSVTFLVAALGLVAVPSGIVEPLIALSIVVVAVLHLVGRPANGHTRWRLPVVFGFGLLHGLGFAGALGIEEHWSWELLGSLLAFNVGLELAQLALIALLFPVVTLLRRTRSGNRLLLAAAVAVTAVGLLWFVERLSPGVDLAALALQVGR